MKSTMENPVAVKEKAQTRRKSGVTDGLSQSTRTDRRSGRGPGMHERRHSGRVQDFQRAVRYHLKYSLARAWDQATTLDLFMAVALAVREWTIDGMFRSEERYRRAQAKRMYYLSLEFLIGRSLSNNLHNLEAFDLCRDALFEMGVDIEELVDLEDDAALGNGGLGRLAACFLDSLATLGMPGFGYGINYEYGLFKQVLDNGFQREKPDQWQSDKSPWQIEQMDDACLIPVYGRVEHSRDLEGAYNPMWLDWKIIVGVPHDMPIVGYGGNTVNSLRLYSARASDEFDMRIFNSGDYLKAVEQKMTSETISRVLYPSDNIEAGRELRLIQEYFLVACAMRDIVRRFQKEHGDFRTLPDKVAIQLNDTHPALAVAELMRILVDENNLPWEAAWDVTQRTLAYTNHTLLPEALEKWPVALMEHVLPRHMQLMYEINHRFLAKVAATWPGDTDRLRRMSLIEEDEPRQVRMAHLSIMGSHSVNGVAALHSDLVRKQLVPDFAELWPERFNNKTNGITQRRWLLKSNPGLSRLLRGAIGQGWITDLDQLRVLEPFAEEAGFQAEFMQIKRANKERLARVIGKTARIQVDPASKFDVQAKRMHEYKRQLLNAMHIIHQYFSIIEDGADLPTPKTYIFAGKAAPGYYMAKLVIRLINGVATVVNNDPRVKDQLKVAFIPDYRVSLAERIIPAADLSEQISTAGKEASGTGNMKFALNGALTIGTLDGANIEIREEVGEENIYIFGLGVEEIDELRRFNAYSPRDYYSTDDRIRRVMDSIGSELFCAGEPGLFKPICDRILDGGDEYFHLADFSSFLSAQALAATEYTDPGLWARKAILNVARIGKFSSDRTIREYAADIWDLKPVL